MKNKKKLIFANLKMNLNSNSLNKLIDDFLAKELSFEDVDVIFAPPVIYLNEIRKKNKNKNFMLAAQNVFYEDSGAYTGEISPLMLRDVGCEWVMIGHSERRIHTLETNEMINKKIISSSKQNLNIIFCVGESYEERRNGKTCEVISDQLKRGLRDIDEKQIKNIVIGYEPVWVIGSGEAANLKDIDEVHTFIDKQLNIMYPESSIEPKIVYGGSVNNNNISDIMKIQNVDGVLVGNASLDTNKFCDIVITVGNLDD
tara:strand:+ start:272 stop:1042 length:771 start_codon:yes stop_codon:yes gene_type:complete